MTTLQRPTARPELTTAGTALPTTEDLAGRLAQHLVAGALVRKSVIDPVPFPVWWRVADALRASLVTVPSEALAEVDLAAAALCAHAKGLVVGPTAALLPGEDAARALRRAQVLVARLVLSSGPTSPTLLHVRLARLRRALAAADA